MALNIDEVLAAAEQYGTVKQTGEGQWITNCPSHDDKDPSLSIGYRDGKVLFNCFASEHGNAGCTFESIIAAYGLSTNGKPVEKMKSVVERLHERKVAKEAEIVAIKIEEKAVTDGDIKITEYPYKDLMGNLRYKKLKKEYSFNCILDDKKRIPYNLDKLGTKLETLPIDEELFIAIHEGEKCADLWNDNFIDVAVGMSFGTKGSDMHQDVLAVFNGITEYVPTNFLIFPDADALDTGNKWADTLLLETKAKSVKVVRLPGLKGKDDVEQWIDRGGKFEELAKLIDETPARTFGWNLRTIDGASHYKPDYLVGKHIIRGHSHIIYGWIGSMKTKLAEDLVICGAAGDDWLTPGDGVENVKAISIKKPFKTMYLDFDNGDEAVQGELNACWTGHGRPDGIVGQDSRLFFDSWPKSPSFKAIDPEAIDYLRMKILEDGYDMVVIDNTRRASGVADENSPQMGEAIDNIHQLGHETNTAMVMLMNTGKEAKRGVRGHSSQLDVDCIYHVTREAKVDKIEITCEKFRGKMPDTMYAYFSYTSEVDNEGDDVLTSFRMYGTEPGAINTAAGPGVGVPNDAFTKAMKWFIEEGGVMEVVGMTVRAAKEYAKEQSGVGQVTCFDAIGALKNEGVITTDSNGLLAIGSKPPAEVQIAQTKEKLKANKASKVDGLKALVIKHRN